MSVIVTDKGSKREGNKKPSPVKPEVKATNKPTKKK